MDESTSKKQIQANRINAQNSIGPKNTEKTRYNALKYGFTSKSLFSKEDELVINEIYDDLKTTLTPENRLQEIVLGQIAIKVWRLKKATHIEQQCFQNRLINDKNCAKACEQIDRICASSSDIKKQKEHMGETLTTDNELILRYEIANETRLMKLIRFFKEL